MLDKRLQEIEQILHSQAIQGREICSRIERSQARKPLCERFHSLDQELNTAPFVFTLMGLTPDAREIALAALMGCDRHLLKIPFLQEDGFVELTLQKQDYTLVNTDGESMEFEHLDNMLEAIRDNPAQAGLSENQVSPLRLRMPAPPDIQGITLFIPWSASTLTSPPIFNRLVTRGNLLILAAPADYEPDKNTRRILEDLSASVDAVWPLVHTPGANNPTGDNGTASSTAMRRFHSFLRSRLILPPLWIPSSPLPGTTGSRNIAKGSIFRQALILARHSERLRSMFEFTIERFEEEQAKIKKIQKQAEQTFQNQRSEAASRELIDLTGRLRSYLNDETGKLTRALADLSRHSKARRGDWGDSIREIIDNFDESDLVKEDATQSTRLEVSSQLLERIESQLCNIVRSQLGRDLEFIRDTRETWAGHIRETLSSYGQYDPVAEARVIDEGEVWENLQPLIKCEVSWHGEIPRSGVFQYFRAAYSPLIMGFMLLSIVFPIITNFIDIKLPGRGEFGFAYIFVIAFIINLVRSRKVLSKKRMEALDKELLRVRDILRGTADRIISAVNQEKNRRLGVYLADLHKEVLRRLEEFTEKISGKKQEQAQREMTLAQNKLRQAEKSIRDNITLAQELQRLNQKSRQAREDALKLLQDPGLRSEGNKS